jgi:hypothetical protein
MIIWDTDPQKLDQALQAAKEGKFNPPPSIKPICEYGTPNGLFIQIVETEDRDAIFKYTVPLLYCHRKIDVFPAIPVERFGQLFVK